MSAEVRAALVTGASSGIGRATALAFAARGVNVCGLARRAARRDALAGAIAALPAPRGAFLPVAGDVTDASALYDAVAQVMARYGRLDILVANAGVGQRGALADVDWRDLETVLRTNIDGVLHSVRAVVPAMRQTGGGHIVIVSSVAFNLVSPYAAAYAASKAFVSSLARSLRLELAADSIHVTDVLAGRTATEFNERRLGDGRRTGRGVPTMPAERVAAAIVRATERPGGTVVVRPFDRLVVWANVIAPGVMGRLARRQYR
ncbi:MAG: SDR family NAD(P)-dependent oxidoreductase [Aggregatilineales bacterium]